MTVQQPGAVQAVPAPTLGVDVADAARVRVPPSIANLMNGQIDRRIQTGVDRALAGVALALDRALAHAADPTRFPLPADRTSLEQVLLRRIGGLPAAERRDKAQAALARITSTGAIRRGHYGELAGLDPRSALAVAEQVRRAQLSAPFSAEDIQSLQTARVSGPPPAGAGFSRLELVVNRVRCIEKTKNFGEVDFADEMVLAASVSGGGLRGDSTTRALGKFGKGDARPVSPAPLFSVPIDQFPAAAVLRAELIEQDQAVPPPAPETTEAEIGALLVGAFGTLFFADAAASGGVILLSFTVASSSAAGAAGAVITVPLVIGVGVATGLAIACALVAVAAGAALLVGKLLAVLGQDEHYPVRHSPQLVLAAPTDEPDIIGRPQTLEFVATADDEGFRGRYELTYTWNLR
jgi:hypothetical protein